VYPGAADAWYDGVDSDCAGDDDFDQDGDGFPVDEDCDDADASRTGPVAETLNGRDDDCDGSTDNLSIGAAAAGVLYGTSSSMEAGNLGNLALAGDLTGDGLADLVACADGSSSAAMWVVSGATAASAAGRFDSYDTAILSASSSYYRPSYVNGPFGDQDGDGVDDLLVGLWHSSYDVGYAFLFNGGSGLSGALSTSSKYQASFTGDSSSDRLVQGALGDLDGDGFADVVTGASQDNDSSTGWGGSEQTGNVSIFQGGKLSGGSDLGDADDQIHGQSEDDELGSSLVVVDLDDDGYADILAGAPGDDDGGSSAGAVYLFEGNAALSWSSQADSADSAKFLGASSSDDLGEDALPMPGDVDGDGDLDLLLPSEQEGKGWLYLGAGGKSGAVSAGSADHVFSGTADDFMTSAAIDSDLDGDGLDEVAVGGDGTDANGSNSGVLWLFSARTGWGATVGTGDAVATIWGAAAGDWLGTGMAGGQDLDGDGREDLVVGAVGVDGGATDGGAVYVLLGW
jgi:hypothetical protein